MLIVHGYSEVCHVCQITKATPSTLESIHQHGIHTIAIAFGNREEKSLRLVVMVAKNLDLNKSWSCKYYRKN